MALIGEWISMWKMEESFDCGTEVSEKEEIDAAGLKVLPGLVDIHSHGAVRA